MENENKKVPASHVAGDHKHGLRKRRTEAECREHNDEHVDRRAKFFEFQKHPHYDAVYG